MDKCFNQASVQMLGSQCVHATKMNIWRRKKLGPRSTNPDQRPRALISLFVELGNFLKLLGTYCSYIVLTRRPSLAQIPGLSVLKWWVGVSNLPAMKLSESSVPPNQQSPLLQAVGTFFFVLSFSGLSLSPSIWLSSHQFPSIPF